MACEVMATAGLGGAASLGCCAWAGSQTLHSAMATTERALWFSTALTYWEHIASAESTAELLVGIISCIVPPSLLNSRTPGGRCARSLPASGTSTRRIFSPSVGVPKQQSFARSSSRTWTFSASNELKDHFCRRFGDL